MVFRVSLREHDGSASWDPQWEFSKPSSSICRATQPDSGYLGTGLMFFVVSRAELDGKYLRVRWQGDYSWGGWGTDVKIYDGSYDRSSDVDFPFNSAIPLKGNGVLQTALSHAGDFGAVTEEFLVDVSGGSEDMVTVFFWSGDSWTAQTGWFQIEWIEVNSGPGGSGNLAIEDFDDSITMERTGSFGDYGYISTGDVLPSDSVDLSSSFTLNNFALLSSSVTIRQPGADDLSSSFAIQKSNSVNLSSSFIVTTPTSNDLSSSFYIPTAQLSSSFSIQRANSLDLSSSVYVMTPGSLDLSSSIFLEQTTPILRFRTSDGVLLGLEMNQDMAWIGDVDREEVATVEIFVDNITNAGAGIRPAWDLFDVVVSITSVAQIGEDFETVDVCLLSLDGSPPWTPSITIPNIPADGPTIPPTQSFWIQYIAPDRATFSKKQWSLQFDGYWYRDPMNIPKASVNLSSSFNITSKSLSSSFSIQRSASVALSSSFSIGSSASLSSSFYIPSAQLSSSIHVMTPASVALSTAFGVSQYANLSSSFAIGQAWLSSSFKVTNAAGSKDLSSSFTVN